MVRSDGDAPYMGLGLMVRVLEASSDAMEIDDMAGRIVYLNDAWCQLFEEDRRKVTGQRWDSVGACSQTGLKESWEAATSEGRSKGTFSMMRSDGKPQRVSYSRTLYRNAEGMETAVITIYRAIAAADYEPSHLLLALLGDRRDKVAVLDSRGHIVATTSAFSDLTGCLTSELTGIDIRSLMPETEEALIQPSGVNTWWAGSVTVARKEGASSSAWVSVQVARDYRRSIVGYVVRAASTDGIHEARDRERQRRHDLRNMFAGILGNAQLILQGRHVQDETTRNRLASIQTATTRSMEILEQMARDSSR